MAELRVAVVGAGRWGSTLIRAFQAAPRCRVAAICDSDPGRLADAAVRVPGARAVPHIDELLEVGAVDAVALSTPPPSHALLALKSLGAGMHVFVEKPMTLCLDDAIQVRNEARRFGRRLMVGHVLQFHPAVVELVELVRSGALGELRFVSAVRLGLSQGSHAWWSLAPHDVSLLLPLFGQLPTAVEARGLSVCGEGHQVVVAKLTFESGLAVIHVSGLERRRTRRLTVVGERMTATFDDHGQHSTLTLTSPGSAPVHHTYSAGPLSIELEQFVDGVLDGTPFESDADAGVRVVRVLEAGERSLRCSGEPQALR